MDVVTLNTDQDRLRTRELTPMKGGAAVDDFFAVAVKSYKDKIQLALVDASRDNLVVRFAHSSIPRARTPNQPSPKTQVGTATMPHWDDRVMYGDEVGLRVRLMDEHGKPIARDANTAEGPRR